MVQFVSGDPVSSLASNSIYLIDVQSAGGLGGECFPASKYHSALVRSNPMALDFYNYNAKYQQLAASQILPLRLLPAATAPYVVMIMSDDINGVHQQADFVTALDRVKLWLNNSYNGLAFYSNPYNFSAYKSVVTDYSTVDIRIHADYGKLFGAVQANIISALDAAFGSTNVKMYS